MPNLITTNPVDEFLASETQDDMLEALGAVDGQLPRGPINLITVGDSITQSTVANSYPEELISIPGGYFTGRTTLTNLGLSGQGLGYCYGQYTPDVLPLFDPTKRNIIIMLIGANDGGNDPTTYVSTLNAYYERAIADGFEMWALLILDRNGSGNWAAFNEGIRKSPHNIKVIETNKAIAPFTDTDYFHDGLHPTELGNKILARFINNDAFSDGSNVRLGAITDQVNTFKNTQGYATSSPYEGRFAVYYAAGSSLYNLTFDMVGFAAFDEGFVWGFQSQSTYDPDFITYRTRVPGSGSAADACMGIGTRAPTEKLHVAGNVRAVSVVPSIGPFLNDAAAATGGVKVGGQYNRTDGVVAHRLA